MTKKFNSLNIRTAEDSKIDPNRILLSTERPKEPSWHLFRGKLDYRRIIEKDGKEVCSYCGGVRPNEEGEPKCFGKNDRGFTMHGGKCEYCGDENCKGDEDRGFGVHKLPVIKVEVKPPRPDVVFKDFDEALDFILKMQKSNPKRFPIQISPKIVKRNRNNLTIHILDDSNPDNPNIVESSKRIFNAARDDEDPSLDPDSFDTLQGLFQRTENPDEDYYRTLKEEEKGLSQYEKLDLTDFEEQNHLNDFKPNDESSEDFSNIRENPKRVMPCPNCDAESMINRTGLHVFTKTHCNNCDKECSSDEKNDRNHCEGCKNTLKCKGRTREIWSQKDENGKKITTCPICQNEGFVPEEEYDSLLEERTFNPVEIQETESTPTTVPTFEHDTSAEDFKEDYDPKNDTLIEPTPKKITPIIQKDNTLSPAEALKKKKETISQMTKKNVVVTTTPEAPSVTTAPKPVININPKKKACDCNTRGGLATDEEIATIKQSPEYNNGIAKIKTQNISPAEKRKEINNFISNQTACKKCRENNG